MKKWVNAEVDELKIEETANGKKPSDNFDGEWVQINDLWYRPGDDTEKLS